MKMRTVEMAVCYSDHTWVSEVFVQIPIDTIPDDLERQGRTELMSLLNAAYNVVPRPSSSPDIVKIWLYNSMDDDDLCEEMEQNEKITD